MKSLPGQLKDAEFFADELHAVYGEVVASRIIAQLARPSRLSFWVNPLLCDRQSEAALPADIAAMHDVLPNPILPGVWSVDRDTDLTASPSAVDAAIYIQNPSSLLAVRALAPQADEEVLDLAAAPGGKTMAMAAQMMNSGRIAAVEPVKGRFHRLKANMARCGVSNVDFYQRDGRGVGRVVPERFDRVLLDAPCSSEARMRWYDPVSFSHWSKKKVKEANRKQKSLILSAYAALKPGGRMVYSTCSFSVAENELVVQHLLKRTDAQVRSVDIPLPEHTPGISSWRGRQLPVDVGLTCRILPDDVWDGFYLAVLQKPLG